MEIIAKNLAKPSKYEILLTLNGELEKICKTKNTSLSISCPDLKTYKETQSFDREHLRKINEKPALTNKCNIM